MGNKDEKGATGSEQMSAILSWWEGPLANATGQINGNLQRFQTLTSDLQKIYADACTKQVNAWLSAGDRIGQSYQELLACRQPQDLHAAQSKIFTTILEETSLQTRAWVEVAQDAQDRCAALVRGAADDVRKQSNEATETKRAVKVG